MNTGKILLGVLAGITAGALLGILYAPDKGFKTRRKIAKKGKRFSDGLTEKLDNIMDEATDKFKSAVKKIKVPTKNETVNVGNNN